MANTITIQKIVDGQRNAVVHVYMASDGASGELSAAVVVDASDLFGSPSKVAIDRIESAVAGFSATLAWDAATDVPFLALPADSPACFDFCHFGGLQNNAGAGVTGDVVINTTGFTATGDAGHITFFLRK